MNFIKSCLSILTGILVFIVLSNVKFMDTLLSLNLLK